jgi:WD40 repeat protein
LTVRIWDAESGAEIVALKGDGERGLHAGFSPDGRRVVTAHAKTARIWNAKTGKKLALMRGTWSSSAQHSARTVDVW